MTINPLAPASKQPTLGDYSDAEVQLANRNSGMPLEFLQHDITPVGAHYLLTHFDVPYVNSPDNWTLSLSGLFQQHATLSIAALQHYPVHHEVVTLECAGNGRACMTPRWPSQPWHYGAVGTARWTGVRLTDVLKDHPVAGGCEELVFSGVDRGADGGQVHHFERSLTLQQIDTLEVMLVWAMNGQPLLPQHGFPLRLIVPGWYGMASVKWLDRITAIDHAFQGYQQVRTYRYRRDADDPGQPVTTLKPKSLMQPPGLVDWSTRVRLVQPGTHRITGRAWGGCGIDADAGQGQGLVRGSGKGLDNELGKGRGRGIQRVELGLNGDYHDATVTPSDHRYGWSHWSADVTISEGAHVLSCRATDAQGIVQPDVPTGDYNGMGNNSVQTVRIVCDGSVFP